VTRHIAGFIILHVIALAALYGAWRADLLVQFFAQDTTGLVAVIAIVACMGVMCVALRRWDDAKFIGKHLPTLGLGGTLVGLSIAISGLSADFDITLLGLHTAFNTTLLGIAGHLWLALNERLLK